MLEFLPLLQGLSGWPLLRKVVIAKSNPVMNLSDSKLTTWLRKSGILITACVLMKELILLAETEGTFL